MIRNLKVMKFTFEMMMSEWKILHRNFLNSLENKKYSNIREISKNRDWNSILIKINFYNTFSLCKTRRSNLQNAYSKIDQAEFIQPLTRRNFTCADPGVGKWK